MGETKNSSLFKHSGQTEQEIFEELKSSKNGLQEQEVQNRLKSYGRNEIAKKKNLSVLKQLLLKFKNPLILMLVVIVVFSFFFGEKISAFIISAMILISIFMEFIQEHKSEQAIEKLQEIIKTRITVYRAGTKNEIDIASLVPGDIVELYAGDMVPADLRIIECKDLFINQSSLTGESFPVEKHSEPITAAKSMTELGNISFMGSSVVSGSGTGIVINTGMNTQFGEISKSLANQREETSFERGVEKFTMMLMRTIMVLVSIIFVVLFVIKQGTFTEALLFSLAVAIGLAPEMLPMIVSINLSKGAQEMAKKKVIVKRLGSIQNLGAIDLLCTDKTGTLTMDQIVLEKHCDVTGKENIDVLKLAYMNSYYQTGLKNILDAAILKHEKISVKDHKKVDEIPFDFSRKIMSVVVENSKRILISKGAPKEIYERCNRYELNGKVFKINAKILSKLEQEYNALSEEGFRVVALGYKEVDKNKKSFSKQDEKDLILKGYLAFLDPPKPETKEVIETLNGLGIEIKILTGDNEIITKKICKDVNLQIKGTITGEEIDKLSDSSLGIIAEKNTIFARLSPIQKERLIKILKANGHTVGFLGDGINDAPSLKAADVGISVNNAVDIAKESADIILLEKSLMVLKDGVLGGRKTFGNIIKYVKMGASSNFGNMFSLTGAALFLPFLPMLPIQIILNNFLYDVSNVALPTDDVDKEYLEKPRKWNIKFIERFMLFIGPLSSLFDFITFGVMLFVFDGFNNHALFQTGWFIESLFSQTLIIYIIRTNRIPFIESKPSKAIILTTIGILLLACLIPFSPIASFFGFKPLPLLYFIILAGMLMLYMVLVHFVKLWVVRKYKEE